MQVDFLIVGQGIAGTFLSYFLLERGCSVLVIDEAEAHSPSRIAAGIMNPVTGRRLTTVWKAAEIFSYLPVAYEAIGKKLGIRAASQKNIIDIFPNPFMRESFLEKTKNNDPYVNMGTENEKWGDWFKMEFGYGEIVPAWTAHLDMLIPAWQKYLQQQNRLRQECFLPGRLVIEKNHIVYNDIIAGKIIFCEGPSGVDNPFFSALPFSKNKGQALLLRIPGLPTDNIYKKSMLLVPLPEKEIFWLGSSYEWNFDTVLPTEDFLKKSEASLKDWLKCDWKIIDHRAGLRPATVERRPFVGLHPLYPSVGIFNGMGTKGCSLAPYFAHEFSRHLLDGEPLTPEADVQRFSRLLSKN